MNENSNIIRNIVVSVLLAYPVGGFVGGLIVCVDCSSSIVDRVMAGVIIGLLSFINFGFSSVDTSGYGPEYNFWPYILVTFLCFLLLMTLISKKK